MPQHGVSTNGGNAGVRGGGLRSGGWSGRQAQRGACCTALIKVPWTPMGGGTGSGRDLMGLGKKSSVGCTQVNVTKPQACMAAVLHCALSVLQAWGAVAWWRSLRVWFERRHSGLGFFSTFTHPRQWMHDCNGSDYALYSLVLSCNLCVLQAWGAVAWWRSRVEPQGLIWVSPQRARIFQYVYTS